MKKITYSAYLEKHSKTPLIDVRSPLEFQRGHLFSAVNIPLFSNSQRAIIGTLYKQKGQKEAVQKALGFVRMAKIAKKAAGLNSQRLAVYCARGGMRSASLSWLLEFLGYEVLLLEQGYKGYRRWVLEQFQKKYPLCILAGKTGLGKTAFLKQMPFFIDLEGLACHRGSAFGAYRKPQPTQETFENLLAYKLHLATRQIASEPPSKTPSIWAEDESRGIGKITIPEPFFTQMQKAPAVILEDSLENRMRRILLQYQKSSFQSLQASILRLQKHLGSERAKQALGFLEKQDKKSSLTLLLQYYDKKYNFALERRKKDGFFTTLDISEKNNRETIDYLQKLTPKMAV